MRLGADPSDDDYVVGFITRYVAMLANVVSGASQLDDLELGLLNIVLMGPDTYLIGEVRKLREPDGADSSEVEHRGAYVDGVLDVSRYP